MSTTAQDSGSRILGMAAYRLVLSKGGHDNLSIHDGTWHAVYLLKRLAEQVKTDEYVRAVQQ